MDVQAIAAVFQGLGSFSIVVAIWIYRNQRKITLDAEARQRAESIRSEMQANRSRLSEAYMNVHSYILNNDENIELIEKLLRRGMPYIDLRNGEMTRAIELIYLKLNAFFLEWNYRKTYGEPMSEFDKTFDHAMRGFATTSDANYEKIVEHFGEIFADFPDEFLDKIKGRLADLKNKPVKPEENLRLLGATDDAIDWFCERENSANLESVDNTIFYRYHGDRRQIYTNDAMPKYIDKVKAALSSKCAWTDLFSNSQGEAAREFCDSLSEEQKRFYHSFMLRLESEQMPLLQMLILRYRSGKKAVLFGWGFVHGRNSNVYISTGNETVAYFEEYFESLLEHSDQVHPPSRGPGARRSSRM